jgi:hypothetical protein
MEIEWLAQCHVRYQYQQAEQPVVQPHRTRNICMRCTSDGKPKKRQAFRRINNTIHPSRSRCFCV